MCILFHYETVSFSYAEYSMYISLFLPYNNYGRGKKNSKTV